MRELFSMPVTSEPINVQLNRAVHMLRAGFVAGYGGAVLGVPHQQRDAYRDIIAQAQGKHEEAYRQSSDNVLTFCGMTVVSHDDLDRIVIISNVPAKTSFPQRGSSTLPSVAGKLVARLPVPGAKDSDAAPPARRTDWESA